MKILTIILSFLLAAPGMAASPVSLSSEVFVQREKIDAAGRKTVVLEAPKKVTPGDRLVFVLAYRNGGAAPATDFTVTNPIPPAVRYANAATSGEVVSVDGGKSWGALAALKVRAADGKLRAAQPNDVTHVRWTLKSAIPAKGSGKLSFQGIVR